MEGSRGRPGTRRRRSKRLNGGQLDDGQDERFEFVTRRDSVPVERRNPRNPNLVEVSEWEEEEEEDEDTHKDPAMDVLPSSQRMTPTHRARSPTPHREEEEEEKKKKRRDIGDELSEIVYSASNARRRRLPRVSPAGSSPPRRGGGLRLPDDPNLGPLEDEDPGPFDDGAPHPGMPGVFLWDWDAGTPFDRFTLDAMLRHMERKARMLSDPLMRFIGGVAAMTGGTKDLALENPNLPLVHTGAKGIAELTAGSAIKSEVLAALMASVLLEQLNAPRAKREKDSGFPSPRLSPLVPRGKERESSLKFEEEVDSDIRDCLELLQMHVEGHQLPIAKSGGDGSVRRDDMIHLPMVNGVRCAPIGPNMAGLPWAQQQGQGPQNNPLLQTIIELMASFAAVSNVQRWMWNEMPENSGFALLKPEMTAMIELAYREIQAISPVHQQFKIIHLITSPRINQRFAALVAGFINVVPGPMQFPNFTSYSANGRSITGARVSSGYMSQARSANAVKSSLKWFRNVMYVPNPQITEIENRRPNRIRELALLRQELDRALDDVHAMFHGAAAFWNMENVPLPVQNLLYDLFDRMKASTRAEQVVNAAQKERAAALSQGITDAALVPFTQARDTAVANLRDEHARLRWLQAQLMLVIPGPGAGVVPSMTQALLGDGAFLVPFVGYGLLAARGSLNASDGGQFVRQTQDDLLDVRPRNIRHIEDSLRDALAAIGRIRDRSQLWRQPFQVFNRLERTISRALSALKRARTLSAGIRKDSLFLESLKDEERVVLTYHRSSDFPKPVNYLYPQTILIGSMFA